MSVGTKQRLVDVDKNVTMRLAICSHAGSTCGNLRPVMRLLEYSCHGVLWLVGVGTALLMSHRIELHEKFINLMIALLFDIVVIGSFKVIFRRTRPPVNHDDMMTILMDKYSFPSGHASRAMMLACFMTVQFVPNSVTCVLFLTWSISVCLSRILLGRHYFSDVAFGAVLGIVENWVVANVIWLPRHICEILILPVQEELHL